MNQTGEQEILVDDLRCVQCSAFSLQLEGGAVVCGECSASFDVVEGVPFIGHYDDGDLLGLIEIAGVADIGSEVPLRSEFDRIEALCQGFYDSGESSDFLKNQNDPFASVSWFANRFSEWKEFKLVSETIDFANKKVLDVGAGSGFDASRLVNRGAEVTALEYHPGLAAHGKIVLPEARWIGGFSHCLPFASESFDIVTVNAALHHMRDVKVAIHEMLRVLKPGGYFVSTGDPFRSCNSSDEDELRVFDDHPAVLKGVNEGILRIDKVLNNFVKPAGLCDLYVVTHGLRDGKQKNISDLGGGYVGWPNDTLEGLSEAWGSLAIRARLMRPVEIEASTQSDYLVRVGDYAKTLGKYSETLAIIKSVIPEEWVNLSLNSGKQSWFELLNGWKEPRQGVTQRVGYGRSRWFLRKDPEALGISFRFSYLAPEEAKGEFILKVNGSIVLNWEARGIGTKNVWRTKLDWLLRRTRVRRMGGVFVDLVSRLNSQTPKEETVISVTFESPISGVFVVEIHEISDESRLHEFQVGDRVVN